MDNLNKLLEDAMIPGADESINQDYTYFEYALDWILDGVKTPEDLN